MKKRAKQLTALLLSAAMTFGMVTTSASATESSSSTGTSSSSTETATSDATGMLGTSASVLDAYDEETLSAMSVAITEEVTSTDSSATEEERAIKDKIYDDIFRNSDSVVDVSDYSTDTATMEALTDEVLEENNATNLVTVTYEEDELTGEATVMSVDMNVELEAVTEEVSAMDIEESDQQTIVYLYSQYLDCYETNVAYLGRQTAWYTSYEDDKDYLGPLGSLLIMAGYTVDEVRDGAYSAADIEGLLMNYYYAYYFGVKYYSEDIIAAKKDALQAVEDAGCTTEAQELMVLTDWMSNNISFDMAYIMNQTSDEYDVMSCENPQQVDNYNEMYDTIYDVYYDQMVTSYGNDYGPYYAAYAADAMVTGIQTVWESCVVGALGDGLGQCVCLGYAMTFAYLVQWLNPDVYAVDGKTLTEDADDWKTVEELNYKTSTIETEVETTETTWDGVTYYAVSAGSSEDPNTDNSGDGSGDSNDSGDEGNGNTGGDATKGETSENQQTDSVGTAADEDGESETTETAATLLVTTDTTETNYPLYKYNDDTKEYEAVVDEEGNQEYVQNYSDSLTTNVDTGYPVYVTGPTTVTKTEEVTKVDTDADYIVDIVEIYYETSISMFGIANGAFNSQHFWSAVKVDGEWYYIDTNYIDIYTECMNQSRVETNGDMCYNYFLFSDDTARSLYDGYYTRILTLYQDVATDTSYEGNTWMYFSGSNIYEDGEGNAYYVYDSTDILSMSSMMGGSDSSDYSSWGDTDMSSLENDTEYKIVRHSLGSNDLGTATDFVTLVDFNNGQVYDPTTEKLEDNELIAELYALHQEYEEIYPALSLTMALYKGKIYFNVANCVLTYDLRTGDVVKIKEYNEVGAVRDTTVEFGGLAYSVVNDLDSADVVVENPPIAGLAIYDGNLYVDVASNYGWISGKSSIDDTSSYGWEFAQSDYNYGYTSLMVAALGDYADMLSEMMGMNFDNDNDEFMFSANFIDTLAMSTVTNDSLEYNTVSVEASCNHNAFTEDRSEEGLIKDGTRVEDEGTACDHHYLKYDETYYNTDDDGNPLTGTCYVCTICGNSLNDYDEDEAEAYEAAAKSAGHNYVADESAERGVVWADYYSSATVNNLVCDVCGDMTQTVTRVSVDDDGNSSTEKVTVYGLDVLNEDDTVTVALDEDSALTCTVDYEVSGKCSDGLVYTYTAYGPEGSDYEGIALATAKDQRNAGTHDYVAEDDAWTWTGDDENGYTAATVSKVTCSVCGETEENLEAVVTPETTEATCTKDGATVYTAIATVTDDEGNVIGTVTDTKTVTIPETGHTYGEPEWTWSEDCSTATATFTCTKECGEEDDVVIVDATMTSKTTDATCTEDGSTVYSATVTFEDVEYTDTKTEILNATGHTYGEPTWTWSDDYSTATATFTCEEGDDTQTVEAEITDVKTTDPTCTEEGGTIYTAEVTFEGTTYTGEANSDPIPATGHDFDEETGECKNGCGLINLSNAATMALSEEEVTYDGELQEPEVTVTSKAGVTLTEGTDYEVSYRDNDIVGTATVTVTGTGTKYVGTLTKTFTIGLAKGNVTKVANSNSGMTITWDKVEGATGYYVYRKTSGSSYKRIKTITSGSTLTYTETSKTVGKSGTTYTYCVLPYHEDSAGIIIKGGHTAGKSKKRLDNCTTSLKKTTSGITVSWNEVKGASGYCIYYKTNKSGSTEYKLLKKITDGSTTSYNHTASKSTGVKYTYKVVAYYKKNSSSSAVNSSFTAKSTIWVSPVTISSLKNSSSKKMTVKWGKNSKATGYQIQYSTSSSFSSYKTVTITSGSTVSKTISSLTKDKKYYVRIRACYENSSGTKYYSAWSTKKSVKISK